MASRHAPELEAEWERIASARLEAEREARRAYRRDLVRVSLECLGSALLGLWCMGFGLHATDGQSGEIAWWGGLVVGYTGIAASLLAAYIRGERRGDW